MTPAPTPSIPPLSTPVSAAGSSTRSSVAGLEPDHPDPARGGPGTASPLALCVVVLGQDAVRWAEDVLGDLCAEGALTVLDGVVLDWPPQLSGPHTRPLANLPRVAAIPETAWPAVVAALSSSDPPAGGPRCELFAPPPALVAPGGSAVLVFCAAPGAAVAAEALRAGAHTVSTQLLAADAYAALRHPTPTPDSPRPGPVRRRPRVRFNAGGGDSKGGAPRI